MTALDSSNILLVNVPVPVFSEAASSWLSRFALSQGADLKTVMDFLGIPPDSDVDTVIVGKLLEALRRKCRLPGDALACHDQVMSNFIQLGSLNTTFLITNQIKRPLTQFCGRCLNEMRTPYIPIHWRFSVWQWCPLHDCLMEVACQNCKTRPTSLIDIADTRAGKNGVAFLNRCMHCGELLSLPEGSTPKSKKFAELRPEQQRQLANGRALLAALYLGWFCNRNRQLKLPISAMEDFATQDDFPPIHSSEVRTKGNTSSTIRTPLRLGLESLVGW